MDYKVKVRLWLDIVVGGSPATTSWRDKISKSVLKNPFSPPYTKNVSFFAWARGERTRRRRRSRKRKRKKEKRKKRKKRKKRSNRELTRRQTKNCSFEETRVNYQDKHGCADQVWYQSSCQESTIDLFVHRKYKVYIWCVRDMKDYKDAVVVKLSSLTSYTNREPSLPNSRCHRSSVEKESHQRTKTEMFIEKKDVRSCQNISEKEEEDGLNFALRPFDEARRTRAYIRCYVNAKN